MSEIYDSLVKDAENQEIDLEKVMEGYGLKKEQAFVLKEAIDVAENSTALRYVAELSYSIDRVESEIDMFSYSPTAREDELTQVFVKLMKSELASINYKLARVGRTMLRDMVEAAKTKNRVKIEPKS